MSIGFERSHTDPYFYVFMEHSNIAVLVVYVNDINITGNNHSSVEDFVELISGRFEVRTEEQFGNFLGMSINSGKDDSIRIHHCTLLDRMILYLGTKDCFIPKTLLPGGKDLRTHLPTGENGKPVPFFKETTLYQQLVGCLLHLSNNTRPYICYATGYFSRFMRNPNTGV